MRFKSVPCGSLRRSIGSTIMELMRDTTHRGGVDRLDEDGT